MTAARLALKPGGIMPPPISSTSALTRRSTSTRTHVPLTKIRACAVKVTTAIGPGLMVIRLEVAQLMLLADQCLMSGFGTISITHRELAEGPIGACASMVATGTPVTTLGSSPTLECITAFPPCADVEDEHSSI